MTTGSSTGEEPLLTIRHQPSFWASPLGWSFASAAGVAVVGLVWLLLSGNVLLPVGSTVTLKGVMASKADFFENEEVQRLLLKYHIRVEVTRRGSREVALEVINQETDKYDFTFPSGQPAADLIKNNHTEKKKYSRATKLFTSPIVLASYRAYAEALVGQGAAERQDHTQDKPLYYTLNTAKFIELGENGKTWNDIDIDKYKDENGRRIRNGNRVLAQSSGVCRSNSAGTYLGLVAFVKNGERAPIEAEAQRLAEDIQPLITATGMPEPDLFRSYVTPEGKGEGPVIVVYEHQYLEYQLGYQRRTGKPDTDRVLLYPRQEFQTDPEFISLKPGGADRLGDVLANDPALQGRMLELGYRVADPTGATGTEQLFTFLSDHGIPAPVQRSDYTRADLPELGLLERMIMTAGRCRR